MSNTPATTQTKQLAPWQNSLMKAKGKFLAITGKEKETVVELGFASLILEGSEKLRACDPASIANAVINVARTGITLNPSLKLCYLIPRSNKCVLDLSYMGWVKILKDYGSIKDIQAIIVYDDETFEESNSQIVAPIHKKQYAKTEQEQLKRGYKGVYCQVLLPDNIVIYTPLTPYWEILKAEKASPSSSSKSSPWQLWREDMIKKTKLKKDCKTLISGSPDGRLSAALDIENENDVADANVISSSISPSPLQGSQSIFGETEEAEVVEDFLTEAEKKRGDKSEKEKQAELPIQ